MAELHESHKDVQHVISPLNIGSVSLGRGGLVSGHSGNSLSRIQHRSYRLGGIHWLFNKFNWGFVFDYFGCYFHQILGPPFQYL